MAYQAIRHSEFKDKNGVQYVISILKKGYTGTSTAFKCGAQGFELKYSGEGEDMDDPFKSSECTFEFNSESTTDDNFIISLIDADESDFLVEIKKDTTPSSLSYSSFWKGVLIVDNATLKNAFYPQAFVLRAVDGISLLKGKKVTEMTNLWNIDGGILGGVIEDFSVDTAGGPTWGGSVYQHRSLVIAALRTIPTSELFGTSNSDTFLYVTNCWENQTNLASSTSYKKMDFLYGVANRSDTFYTQKSEGEYKFMSIHEMLKSILNFYNLRLFMDTDGYWREIQVGVYETNKTADLQYVRYIKTDSGKVATGSGITADFNIGDILTTSDTAFKYAVGETEFAYEKQIKEIELKTKKADTDLYDFNDNFADNPTTSIGLNANPIASDYSQTFVYCQAGSNMTFTFTARNKYTRTAQGAAQANYYYLLYFFQVIKLSNYYLRWNPTTQKYEWSTTFQPVFSFANNYWHPVLSNIGGIFHWSQTYGDSSTGGMDVVPVDGQIEYYNYWDLFAWFNGSVVSVNHLSTAHLDVDYDPDIMNNGVGAKSIEINLFVDGQQVQQTDLVIQNRPSGTLVDGGLELQREVLITGQPGIVTNKTIYNYDGSDSFPFFDSWKHDTVNNWRNRYTVSTLTSLPALKGIEMIGLQPKNRNLLRGDIIHKLRVSGSTIAQRPFTFKDMFEYHNNYYIPNGYTFYAKDAFISGEFMKVSYDLGNAQSQTPANSGSSNVNTNPQGPSFAW